MIFSNLHTHTHYCDGAGEPEEYVQSAINKGLSALGVSGHAPVPFDSWWNMTGDKFSQYIAEIRSLQKKYSETLPVYVGAEIDFIENTQEIANFRSFELDYIIAAVHYLIPPGTDEVWDFIISPDVFADGLRNYYDNDILRLQKHYFRQMNVMIEKGGFDIVAHIDQIVKFNKGNRFFDESDSRYRNLYKETIDLCREKNIIVEVNTRGKLKGLTENFYPSFDFLKECCRQNVPVLLSADAHTPEELDSLMPAALEHLKKAGYKEIRTNGRKLFEAITI